MTRTAVSADRALHDGHPYTLRHIQQMLGLGRSAIMGLIGAGFVAPARGARNEYRFTFQDVVLLRTAYQLRAAQVPPRRMLRALRQLRTRLPADLPMSGLRIRAVGQDIAVRDGHAQWEAESGQWLLDFEVAPAGSRIAFLPHDGGPAAVDTAAVDTDSHSFEAAFDRAADHGTNRAADRGTDRGTDRGIGGGGGSHGDAEAWFERGEALESVDRARAADAYRHAIVLHPQYADAYLNLGALLCEDGQCAQALELYDRAVAICPDETLLHFNRAIALEDLNRPMDALASYERSLALAPELADAHFNAARLHEQLGHKQKALRHYSAYRRLRR